MIRVGIIGGSGYAAGELLRILIYHPDVELKWVHSRTVAGQRIVDVHQGLHGEIDMNFTSSIDLRSIDVLFCCRPAGKTREFIETHTIPEDLKIIDLSRDFRLAEEAEDFVYGLSELNRKPMVRGASRVANPGCLAMAVELSLLPLAKNLLLNSDIHTTVLTGATSEGAERRPTTHYAWRNNNAVVYRPFRHTQEAEILQTLQALQQSFNSRLHMVPIRGPFSRGIMAVTYLDCPLELPEIIKIYQDYFSDHNFTHITSKIPDLKDVVNTNKCIIHLDKIDGRLLITAVIDNLLKGAAGNAVHTMNLLFGLSETTGLTMKSAAF
ncbi:MAG: N-acetyl-gamma-glutamyl-phosphate reductase [Duncaniella sp.]|nr:N-acetyl-gamma-glutamyl-phosphate reductase [Duncaniella sp.]MDE5751655.1 N-acetyl-gamma-glutamyl-phosphate reductase [Duncaniella sp.]MDE5918299.1 N-acetyl-gamma-glutamyl-phosphate reductase [Duncaniella sp.]MDE6326905.1 N-acetyl-gamma-glutamyl-phosphate reductase [Duncaniella sp.]MDE6359123.1 N-acetyl-gamma-glutamyl-phosphate reductase [Duncaniella sp.]